MAARELQADGFFRNIDVCVCSEIAGLAHVFPLGALTQALAGEKLAELATLHQAGCIAFS